MPRSVIPAYRLRSLFWLRVADRLARVSSATVFKPAHELVRLSHSILTGALLRREFQNRFVDVVDVKLRHSQTLFGRFHALLSDVDVTIIVQDTTSIERLTQIGAHFESLRRRFIFFGEVEIYTATEFDVKSQLEFAHPNLIELFRVTRKFSWIPNDLDTPYHGLKSRRSRRRNQDALKSALESLEVTRLANEIREIDGTAARRERLLDYMGASFSELPLAVQRLIYDVSPTNALGETPIEDMSLPAICIQLCRYEEIQARGRERMLLSKSESVGERKSLIDWADQLHRYASRAAPALFTDFQIHDCRVRFASDSNARKQDAPSVATEEALKREFGFFLEPAGLVRAADVFIRFAPALNEPSRVRRLGRSGIGEVSSAFRARLVCTASGARLRYRFNRVRRERLQFEIDVDPPTSTESLVETALVINAVHAAVGESLERKGYLRLHAAAVLTSDGATVVAADKEAGKSTWIHQTLETTNEKIYSDETTWIRDGLVHPYPVPIARKTESPEAGLERVFLGHRKTLTLIPAARVAPPAKLHRLVAVVDARFPRPIWTAKIVFGIGLAQMWPYLLRTANLLWLMRVASRRLNFAVGALNNRDTIFTTRSEFRRLAPGLISKASSS